MNLVTGRTRSRANATARVRAAAFVTALTFALFSATVVVSADGQAAPLVLPVAAAAGLPLSVVGAGVSGGAFSIGAAGAVASAGVTLGAMLGADAAIDWVFGWGDDVSPTLGDPPSGFNLNGTTVCSNTTYCKNPTSKSVTYDSPTGTVVTITGKVGPRPHSTYATTGRQEVGFSYSLSGGSSVSFNSVSFSASCGGSVSATAPANGWNATSGSHEYIWSQYDGSGSTAASSCSPSYINWNRQYIGQIASTTIPDGGWTTSGDAGTVEPGTTPLWAWPWVRCFDPTTSASTIVKGPSVATTRQNVDAMALTFPACAPPGYRVEAGIDVVRKSDGVKVSDGFTPWPVPPSAGPVVLTRTLPDGQTVTCQATGGCPGFAEVAARHPATGTGASTAPVSAPDGSTFRCTYAGAAVAVAECSVVPDVIARPTAAGPGTGTAPSSEVCNFTMSAPWRWPLEGIKCAFDLSPATKARAGTVGATLTTLPPMNLLSDLPAWLAPLAGLGQSCPDWSVQVGPTTHSVICEQGFTNTMHNNRTLFGAAMTLALLGPFLWRVWHGAIPVIKVGTRS